MPRFGIGVNEVTWNALDVCKNVNVGRSQYLRVPCEIPSVGVETGAGIRRQKAFSFFLKCFFFKKAFA
jgi:hypothetical protein